jgi:hypothetical protein
MIRLQILCDGCRQIGFESQGRGRKNAGNMRVDLARHGWINNTNRAGVVSAEDYCPSCWRIKEKAKEIQKKHFWGNDLPKIDIKTPLSILPLSVRVQCVFKNLGCATVGDALQFPVSELLKCKGFGRVSLHEWKQMLGVLGLADKLKAEPFNLGSALNRYFEKGRTNA